MLKNTLLSLIFLFSFFACSDNNSGADQSDLTAFADSLFTVHVDSAKIAGASVIVYKDGEMLLNKAYGYASLELSVPMPENASFEIGSVTKQFTASAILRLMDAGKLSLDDDFTKYLDFDTKGRTVTIDHLLNHTSGIASYTEIQEFGSLMVHKYDRDSLVRIIEEQPFLFEPGEALIYNNSAYYFLGLIIEKITGKAYEEYLSEQFFMPLGMNNTYYCSTTTVTKQKAYGYDYRSNGLQQKQYIDHTWPYAGGSLCSTAEDLLIWLKALHEGDLLSKKLYSSLITPETLNDGTPVRYAKALVNYNNFGNQHIGHGGGIPGFLSETRYFPEVGLYIICLVNTAGPSGGSFFANELTWQLLDKKEVETQDLDIDLSSLAGKYSGQARGRMISIKVNSTSETLSIEFNGSDNPVSLTDYLGENTWSVDNDIIKLKDGVMHLDQRTGHYVLLKEK